MNIVLPNVSGFWDMLIQLLVIAVMGFLAYKRLGKIKEKTDVTAHEVQKNGGGSMADDVSKLLEAVEGLNNKLDDHIAESKPYIDWVKREIEHDQRASPRHARKRRSRFSP